MVLKVGSRGKAVKTLQGYLGIKADGIFGAKTELAVMGFQTQAGLKPDGIVGRKTWSALELATTDLRERSYETKNGLLIHVRHMDPDQYKGESNKEFVFLHHTGGWDDPEKTIKDWNDDNRGAVGTEFVVGGQSINGRDEHDGMVFQAFPDGHYAWHLGTVGSRRVHVESVGIEMNSFGPLKNGRTWTGRKVDMDQICRLSDPFRKHNEFHKYSDDQLKSTKLLIMHIAERDNIDVRKGLVELIKKEGAKAFEWKKEAYYGRVRGLWTHTNVRTDKFDCFPQPQLIDMLLTL